jgi:hypothetical protein
MHLELIEAGRETFSLNSTKKLGPEGTIAKAL